MDKTRVVVTGLGVVSSIGIGVEDFWRAMINGKSGISDVDYFDTSDYPTHKGGEIKDVSSLKAAPKHASKASQFAINACQEALASAKITKKIIASHRIGVVFGTTMAEAQAIEAINSSWISAATPEADSDYYVQYPANMIASHLSNYFGFDGPSQMLTTACAAGNYAIIRGVDMVRNGVVDIAIVGGADAFSRIAYTGFNRLLAMAPEKCQPFDRNREGMMLGEGSGVLVIESMESAKARGADIIAEIKGIGLTYDANHMTIPNVDGVASVIRKALQDAEISPSDVDYISAHGTGTPANDKTEALAIGEIFGDQVPVSSIKSMLGHTMGAASAMEAVACVLALLHQEIPPSINFSEMDPDFNIDNVSNKSRKAKLRVVLNNSFAFGGNNACLAFSEIT